MSPHKLFGFTQVDQTADSACTQLIGANTAERAHSLDMISADEAGTWVKTLYELCDAGRFFCTLTGFLVTAQKTAIYTRRGSV